VCVEQEIGSSAVAPYRAILEAARERASLGDGEHNVMPDEGRRPRATRFAFDGDLTSRYPTVPIAGGPAGDECAGWRLTEPGAGSEASSFRDDLSVTDIELVRAERVNGF
jgi:hypothetical protein